MLQNRGLFLYMLDKPYINRIIMNKLYLLLFFCCIAVLAKGQVTSIPDPVFEQKLIQLGIDSDGLINGQMLTVDAIGVRGLDLSGTATNPSNIQDLTGIAAFSDLDTLYCQHNQLTNLSLIFNTQLKVLLCHDNQLATLDVSGSPDLYFLHCFRNNLTTLDLTSNPSLTYLECYTNPLGNLDVTNQANLLVLNCSDNQLDTVDVRLNTKLITFYCANNQLKELDLSQNGTLTFLDCQSNQLSYLEVSNNPMYTLQCSDNQLTDLEVINKPNISFLDCSDNQLSALNLLGSGGLNQLNCTNNPSYLYICVNSVALAQAQLFWQKPPLANYTQNCYPRAVVGRVSVDDNSNCQTDAGEEGLMGSILTFQKGNQIYQETTIDTLGNYVVNLDTGTYQVTVVPPNSYWTVCPTSQQVTIDTSYNLIVQNWSLQASVNCPLLEVDIAAPFLRKTGGGSTYTVQYCNQGTVVAPNAQLEVALDDYINVVGFSQVPISQVGNTYQFNLGNVGVGQCGTIQLQVIVDTSALFGQTHCATAQVYPDSICVPVLWNGARLSSDVNCVNNIVEFRIENTGSAMSQAQLFSIFEDDIMMRTGGIILGPGEDTVIQQTAQPRRTYRISVQQGSGYPSILGDSIATAVIEGCLPDPNGGFNTDYVTQFSNGSSSPFRAVDCQKNIGSYDPNDKTAQPVGYDPAFHFINDNVELDYRVRFQNTGTDTAFNIVIIDTISDHLDLSTIQMGASSHPYTWSVANNVLQVTYNNVMLPDSNINEPLSNGFFRFRIAQKRNNPVGTVINNTAYIYFDYNPPIVTNTTFHTIGDNFLRINLSNPTWYTDLKPSIMVYPNPFETTTTIRVEGSEVYSELELVIYDALGRMVKRTNGRAANQVVLDRKELEKGIYFYQLWNTSKLIGTGKVVVN